MKNVIIHAALLTHVLKMRSVWSIALFLLEQWAVFAFPGLPEKEMSVVTKLVRIRQYFFFFRLNIIVSWKVRKCSFISVEPEPIGCSSDIECSSNQACRSRSCINPCTTDKPCSTSAFCTVDNHRVKCQCPPGFEGDPYQQCRKSKHCMLFKPYKS